MKPIKMLGLAALAALMAMAFVGATSAMAEKTALCTADETECTEGNEVTSIHETTVAGSPAELLSSAGTVTCDVLFSGTPYSGSVVPEVISGNFTYSNCKRNGTESCTVEEKNGPVEISVLKESHETGKVTGKGEVNVHCGSFINCTYDGTNLTGTAKGPLLSTKTNGSVELSEQSTNHVGGLFCPATAKLDITTTPLSATYITKSRRILNCVFVGTNNGEYESSACTTKAAPKSYVDAYVPAGTGANVHVCVFVGTLHGLYLGKTNNSTCNNQDGTRLGAFELGETS